MNIVLTPRVFRDNDDEFVDWVSKRNVNATTPRCTLSFILQLVEIQVRIVSSSIVLLAEMLAGANLTP